jgi:hypothetical protein
MFKFGSTKNGQNWEKFLGETPTTRKAQLLDKCKKLDVTIFIDDATENALNNPLRGVASEAELERRLNAEIAVHNSKRANIISITAVVIALISLIATVYAKVT